MEDSIKESVQYVRCLKCDKIIKCSRYDTSQLIDHIKRDHPEVTVVENGAGAGTGSLTGGGAGGLAGAGAGACGADRQQSHASCNNMTCPNRTTYATKGHLFRTSIERWRPANGTIYCPFCCQKKQPLVKMRNERLSGNSCAANCMLACWPLCFLPFLLPGNDKEYLYCANCKCFLGLYDKTNNCIRPNKQFSEKIKIACEEAKRKGQL